jgi:hypothetical protein
MSDAKYKICLKGKKDVISTHNTSRVFLIKKEILEVFGVGILTLCIHIPQTCLLFYCILWNSLRRHAINISTDCVRNILLQLICTKAGGVHIPEITSDKFKLYIARYWAQLWIMYLHIKVFVNYTATSLHYRLRHYATSRKVACSVLDEVKEIFQFT